jgi:hypothetical protein
MNYYDNFNMLCKHVRAYILYLFRSILFTDLIKRYVPLIYLTLLDDFNIIPIYSWGSTILVCFTTSMSCMYEEGQTCWEMFVTSIGMKQEILSKL